MSKNPQITTIIDKFVDGLPPFVTVKEAAEIRRCCKDHVYRLIGRGRLRAVKDGGKTLDETRGGEPVEGRGGLNRSSQRCSAA